TLFLGIYNENTRKLRYVNAGHNPPVLICDGQVSFLKEGSTVIGVFDTLPSISTAEVELKSGSLIFNYTDGMVESDNEEVYVSDQELVGNISKNAHLPVDDLNEAVLKDIQERNNAKMNSDDITILSIRIP